MRRLQRPSISGRDSGLGPSPCCLTEGSRSRFRCCCWLQPQKAMRPFNICWMTRMFLVTVIVADYFDRAQPLPAHRMIVNAIGDADLCGAALKAAMAIVARTDAPVINAPAAVQLTGRADNAVRLSDIPGVITPATVTVSKELLAKPDAYRAIRELGFALTLFYCAHPAFTSVAIST